MSVTWADEPREAIHSCPKKTEKHATNSPARPAAATKLIRVGRGKLQRSAVQISRNASGLMLNLLVLWAPFQVWQNEVDGSLEQDIRIKGKWPRSGGLNLGRPFKAGLRWHINLASRSDRMNSTVADATGAGTPPKFRALKGPAKFTRPLRGQTWFDYSTLIWTGLRCNAPLQTRINLGAAA